MQLKDRLFQQTFSRLFVYNILFEDSEVDQRYLALDEDSQVLAISGAGCGVASMLARHPARIDAVDINPHHLALSALKVTAAQRLQPYSSFYDLFGRGWLPDPEPIVRRLALGLPPWMQRYWKNRHALFNRTLYGEGLTSRIIRVLRSQTGIDAGWLRWLMTQDLHERLRSIDDYIAPFLARPWVRAVTRSPVQLLALGINFKQAERMLEAEGTSLSDFILHHIKRLADTDLPRNWFVWYYVTGQFHHDDPEGVPPYLRRDSHEASLESPTDVRYHRGSIFGVLEEAGPNSWSHFCLLDVPDWLPEASQKRLLEELQRTGREGATILYRSVEEESIFERHGMADRFPELESETEKATQQDRTRQYKRVRFHRLAT